MKTHAIFPIDKKDLCDTGCKRMAIHGVTISEDGAFLAEIKVCVACLKDQVPAEVYGSR
jgi:hypothetical protein